MTDGKGSLYVSENTVIRKIDLATATVTTIAGSPGVSGSNDGIGSAARFSGPYGLVADPAGNIYLADNQTIRKLVIATATVSTIAGSAGKYGSDDGIGIAARFDDPEGLALDGAGNLYVADTGNATVRRIALATSEVTTFAGTTHAYFIHDGIGSAAGFGFPQRLVWDGTGKLLISDASLIRSIDPVSAAVTTLAGGAGVSVDGIGTAAGFYNSEGLTVDGAGNLYVADTDSFAIRRMVLATGAVTTVAGLAGQRGTIDGAGSAARFGYPVAAVANRVGSIYVADTGSKLIRKVVLDTGAVTTVAVGDVRENNYLQALTLDGAGNLFFAEDRSVYQLVLATGAVTTLASVGESNSPAPRPSGLAADGAGNLYVANTRRSTILKIVIASGTVTTLAGLDLERKEIDGTGSAARFAAPAGLALDGIGNLYIADQGGPTIRKLVLATGEVTTLAGLAGYPGTSDGIGSSARFSSPTGLAFDGVDSLYVADPQNGTVRKITLADARVTTAVGTPASSGIMLGPLPGSLSAPSGVCVTGRGALVVVDVTAADVLIAR